MSALAAEALNRCRKGTPPLTLDECAVLLEQIPDWALAEHDGHPILERRYSFADFACALAFANQVGALAEAADHHPMLQLQWGAVRVQWWTHVIPGLHRNDFIMAARTGALLDP
ncbi:MAG TPA: 4a-hydroxytetrahydrobiopterin dehydratase [Hyphomicrobiales bacterium]|nr:4a-hydroxytetrahydrobiopterin dehydratase [Hyphomicrobiales bacterium]